MAVTPLGGWAISGEPAWEQESQWFELSLHSWLIASFEGIRVA